MDMVFAREIAGRVDADYFILDARMSFGFAPNRWITGPHEQDRSMAILRAVYASLAKR